MGQIPGQLPDTSIQLLPIIEAFAQNNLAVHFDSGLIKRVHLFQCFPGEPVVEHPAAQVRIHGLEGNVDGLQAESDDPLQIMPAHVGQGHIVSLEEGQPGIVVFKIERIPHPRRHLVDKTEDALISAGTVLVHQPLLKFHSQVFVTLFLNLQLPLLAVRLLDQQYKLLFLYIVAVIKYILDLLPVHCQQLIPRLDSHLPGNAALLYGTDPVLMCHMLSPDPGIVAVHAYGVHLF